MRWKREGKDAEKRRKRWGKERLNLRMFEAIGYNFEKKEKYENQLA